MKKLLGIGIIAGLFISIFIWMVQTSSLHTALKVWGQSLAIIIVAGIGVFLMNSDD